MLKYFKTFEHTDIWQNLEENCLISFRDSNKKRMYGTRSNKKGLMICPFLLKYFSNFEHQSIQSNLEENSLITFKDSNKKRIYGTRSNKKCLMICPFLLKYFSNFEHHNFCITLVRVATLWSLHFWDRIRNNRMNQDKIRTNLFLI